MPVSYLSSLKDARMNAVVASIDAGGAAGKLCLYTSSYGTLIAEIPLAFNPCGTVSGGVLTFTGTLQDTAANAPGGTAVIARILRSDGVTAVVSGLVVGQGTGDINLTNNVIVTGQPVTISTATITHSA